MVYRRETSQKLLGKCETSGSSNFHYSATQARILQLIKSLSKKKPKWLELSKNSVEVFELLGIKNRAPQLSMFAFTDTTVLVSCCPKTGKKVPMSTLHKNDEIGTEENHPSMILNYNTSKWRWRATCIESWDPIEPNKLE